jgi:hypothetical protein
MMIEHLHRIARENARGDRTGWARRGDIHVAYYPRSRRYAHFLNPYGAVNRRDLERYLAEAA